VIGSAFLPVIRMTRRLRIALCTLALAGIAAAAHAQQLNIAGFDRLTAYKYEQLGEKHYLFTGSVELEKGDSSIYADSIEYFEDQERAIARGNVVVTQGANRIAADHADFNTRTQLGTFYQASGIATVRQGRQQAPAAGGIIVPQMLGQDNDVYYFGETVEKIGPKKYKITNGGFSTCVQPTPRWDLTADTIVLNIDHYTLLRQALLNVKGVPMLYLPWLYYPTTEDDRATGFLIPTYGHSTVRGHSLHNAFFWAIDRSRDATFLYDYYSITGSGAGAEYRYNRGGGSDGQITGYILDQKETTYTDSAGNPTTQPASKSYTLNGFLNQALPNRFRARAQVDYFSDIVTNQTFNTDVYSATRNRRYYSANVIGLVDGFAVNGTFDRTEWFSNTASSAITGSSPRLQLTRSERPIRGRSPIYFGANTEFVHLDRQTLDNGIITDDRTLGRFDFMPQIRYPFTRWPFLTINSTLSWRETFYTRSLDLRDPSGHTVLDDDVNRQYFTAGAQLVGPVFTRVFNTPDNGYAERFKHTIEPYLNLQRTSSIDNYNQIVKIEPSDQIYGGTTSFGYGLNNRLYAKRRLGQASVAQEILALEIGQTYYSNPAASQVDPRYSTSTTNTTPNNFSPVAINLRATPTPNLNGNVRAEIDSRYRKLRQMSASGTVNWRQQLLMTAGWSHSFYIAELPGFNNPDTLSHYLNLGTTIQTRDRRYGSIYSFNYDIQHSAMLQQRISGFYNAQCCGIAFEYQRYNYAGLPQYIAPADHRFFLSFTLAGLGNFSPLNGGLGGVPH
jgi:LPS-assembly protein